MIECLWADWPAADRVKALTTTRQGGVSQGGFSRLNLAGHVGDDAAAVEQNRQRLCQSLAIKEPVWLSQVHGTQAANTTTAQQLDQADAIVSNQSGAVCAVLTADCLPLLFCNQQATVIAAAHAGWRGLAAGVIETTVAAMQENNSDLMVWLGPAIGADCFEVGQEVFNAFVGENQQAVSAFTQTDEQHYLADIYQLARLRLNRLGIEKIYGGGLCTYTDEARFYSFRKNKVSGRMASMIWLSSE